MIKKVPIIDISMEKYRREMEKYRKNPIFKGWKNVLIKVSWCTRILFITKKIQDYVWFVEYVKIEGPLRPYRLVVTGSRIGDLDCYGFKANFKKKEAGLKKTYKIMEGINRGITKDVWESRWWE